MGVRVNSILTWIFTLPYAVQVWSVMGGLLVALSVGLFFGRVQHPRQQPESIQESC